MSGNARLLKPKDVIQFTMGHGTIRRGEICTITKAFGRPAGGWGPEVQEVLMKRPGRIISKRYYISDPYWKLVERFEEITKAELANAPSLPSHDELIGFIFKEQ